MSAFTRWTVETPLLVMVAFPSASNRTRTLVLGVGKLVRISVGLRRSAWGIRLITGVIIALMLGMFGR